MGSLIPENISRGNERGSNGRDIVKSKETTLQTIGITKDQSSAFQQIASIPEEIFEEFIQEKKEAVNNAAAELAETGARQELVCSEYHEGTRKDIFKSIRVEFQQNVPL